MTGSSLDQLTAGDLPRVLGRYELQGILGEGGMARVFRAELRGPAGFRKRVALKIIKVAAGAKLAAENAQRFVREARLCGLLKHPNIIDVYELGEAEGQFFICMELVEGMTLSRVIRRGRVPPAAVVLEIAAGISAGLSSAHSLSSEGSPTGLVHRDLKPSNVLLSWDGDVKVADFGIAITQHGELAETIDESGRVVGTLSYMSPEQLNAQPLDSRSDLFSLGLVLSELAIATPLPRQHVRNRLMDEGEVSLVRPLLPEAHLAHIDAAVPGLSRILLRCLEPMPQDRYDSAAALSSELDALRRQVGVHPQLRAWLPTVSDPTETVDEGVGVQQSGGAGPTRERPPRPLPSAGVSTPLDSRSSLGPNLDSFVGREADLAELGRFFDEGARLVTVKGTGGAGKTRFAQHFARGRREELAGGAWFVDLTEACSPLGVLQAMITALGIPLGRESLTDLSTLVGQAIAARGPALLVLDNFEQVVEHAAVTLGRWRELAPEARFLATSREPLRLRGELVFLLDPLPEDDGIALFQVRAEAAGARWPASPESRATLARIVDQLDGLPLAIELAAARARLLSPTQLLDRLSDRFRLLGGRADDTGRQTTLRGLIDWSWDLLEPWERAAIAQLSVFRNGFFMEAAEAVLDLSAWPEAPWALDVVGSLLDKSLLRSWEVGGLPRFGMYVSIRDYATEQLEQGAASDREALALRSATYYARFGTVEYRDLLNTHGGGRRRQLLALELENLLAGAEVAIGAGDPSVAGGCVLGAWEQFRMAGPFLERAEVLTRVLAMDGLDDLQRMRLLGTRGWLLHLRGQPDEVLEHYEAALAIARTLGDRRWQGVWLGSLGILHRVQGRIPEAKKHYEAALSVARELGDRGREGNWLGDMGSLHRQQGRIPEALDYTMAALSIARELGDRRFEGIQLGRLGSLHKGQGRIPEAREHMEAALAIARELGHRLNEGMQLGNLGDLFLVQDQSEDAGRHFEQAILIGDEALTAMAGAFRGSLALVRAGAGNVPEARALLDRGEEQLRGVDALELAKLQCKRGQVEHRAGKVAVAQAALDEARTISSERGVGPDSELGRAVADLARLLEGVPV